MLTSSTAVVVAVFIMSPSSGSAEWVFTWPYTEDGACVCENSAVGTYQNFTSEVDCLTAFAETDVEFCRYKTLGVTQEQCSSVVSLAEGLLNGDCTNECTRVVANSLPLNNFLEDCRFEFVIDFDDSVAVLPDSCFSNYVYGWSDYDSTNPTQQAPLDVFSGVPTAAQCQELCQHVPECVAFSWRAMPDTIDNNQGFQNAPETCIVYDQAYMDGVLAFDVDAANLEGANAFCNIPEVSECAAKPWDSGKFSLFEDYSCLTCDCQSRCAWLSGSHITGPAFCDASGEDICKFSRPSWTSTLPPCEDSTDASTEAGTAETDTALETTEEIRTTTVEIETTEPEPTETTTEIELETTTEPETTETTTEIELETTTGVDNTATEVGTAETDTALTSIETQTSATTNTIELDTTPSSCPCAECPCEDECEDEACNDSYVNDDCMPDC